MSYVHHLTSLLNSSTKNNNGIKWTISDNTHHNRPDSYNEIPSTPNTEESVNNFPWIVENKFPRDTTTEKLTTALEISDTTEKISTIMAKTTEKPIFVAITTEKPILVAKTTEKPIFLTQNPNDISTIQPNFNATSIQINGTATTMTEEKFHPLVISITMLPLLVFAFVLNILSLSLLIKKRGTKLLGHLSHSLFATLAVRNLLYCVCFLTPLFVHLAYGLEGYFCVYLGVMRLFLELVTLWTCSLLVIGCLLVINYWFLEECGWIWGECSVFYIYAGLHESIEGR